MSLLYLAAGTGVDGMNNQALSEFLRLLVILRTASPSLSATARDRYFLIAGRAWGFIAALEEAALYSRDELARMNELVANVIRYLGLPFPCGCNAGPVMPVWEALKRRETAREATADAAEQVPAPTTRPGLRLLCLLVPSRTGEARSLPIHTLHRVPPYASLHGRYHDGQGRGRVALDPLDVPGGTGFYLRETHARAPSPEVLARCLRQRQTDSFRADPRTLRAGGLSHDL